MINIYASTEAGSLLYSNTDKFSIPKKYEKQMKIFKNELLIHKSLINDSNEIELHNDWFHTNDKVKIVEKGTFIFLDRKNSFVNWWGKNSS